MFRKVINICCVEKDKSILVRFFSFPFFQYGELGGDLMKK